MSGAPCRVGALICWVDTHGRSVGLVEVLDLEPVFMPWARPRLNPVRTILGWGRSWVRTTLALRRLPAGSLVVVQVPPVFAALASILAGRRHAVVLDLHSGALNDPIWHWSHGALRWAMRRAAAVVVTTTELVDGLDLGATPVLELHDPLVDRRPVAEASASVSTAGDSADGVRPYVVFPAGGAADEPFAAVIDAAARLEGSVDLLVTGRVAERLAGSKARATGFLPDEQYRDLLAGAAAVLALTTRQATMQRTAYEALELGVPIVASDTEALRGALGAAATFVAADGSSIAAGITEAVERGDALRAAGVERFSAIQAESVAVLARLRELPPRSGPLRAGRPSSGRG